MRESLVTFAAMASMMLSVGGCCIPYGDSEWTNHFEGTIFNLGGDGERSPRVLDSCRIAQQSSGGGDAIVMGQGWDNSEIVVFCRLRSKVDTEYAADTGQNAGMQAWLVRGRAMPHSFVTRGPSFLDLSPDRRATSDSAFPMKGSVLLRIEGGRIKSLKVDLKTVDPIPYARDSWLELQGKEPDPPNPFRSPLIPADRAAIHGNFRGVWERPCHLVPFI